MSDEPVTCPAEGCDYSGMPTSVGGHYQAKTDGKHPGGRQRCLELLADSGQPAGPSEPVEETNASPSPQEPSHSGEDAARTNASENPVMGRAEPRSEPQANTGHSEQSSNSPSPNQSRSNGVKDVGGEPVCIRCGGELYDFRNFETGRYHAVNGNKVWVRGDYQCSSCAMWLEDDSE